MGYFPNGTAGAMFEAENCARCGHEDDKDGCPVMLAHILFAYEECNATSNAKRMLDMLIPLDAEGFNKRCAMYTPRLAPKGSRRDPRVLELRLEELRFEAAGTKPSP